MEKNNIVIYKSDDGQAKIDVMLDGDNVWLNAYQMAELFNRDDKTIRKHIANALKEELKDEVVVAKFATTTKHGAIEEKTQESEVNFYNLDVIISVGYRVKSQRGVEFRRWANKVLKEYLIKGYAVRESLTVQKDKEEGIEVPELLNYIIVRSNRVKNEIDKDDDDLQKCCYTLKNTVFFKECPEEIKGKDEG